MTNQYKNFAKKLKNFRVSQFKTQKDISDRSSLSLRTVSNIESGENVSVENLLEYLESLGLLQSFYDLPPVADMRFEDVPNGKYERQRVRKKKTKIVWEEDK